MEPEPLTDVLADSGFDVLVEKGGVGQNVLFTFSLLRLKINKLPDKILFPVICVNGLQLFRVAIPFLPLLRVLFYQLVSRNTHLHRN